MTPNQTRTDRSTIDLAIIGGGINGTGIARDAAGRGWSVLLAERDDLASATSSASTKLIHGGLRYLEYYEFRLVREALMEREVLWGIAPHIIWPLRFVLPHHAGIRPAWLLRTGLFLYDHIGGRKHLPPTTTLDLRTDPAGAPLKPGFVKGFEYSDCWVEDSRLVVLNARDAANRGAEILTRTAVTAATREHGAWTLTLQGGPLQDTRQIRARALINAAGPWVANVQSGVMRANTQARVRLVRAYGTRTTALLNGATTLGDLGPAYGAGITEAELAHLKRDEFVTCAADAVWRRSRLGLRLTQAEIDRIDNALARL